MRPFCHLLVNLEWLFKMVNHFVHSYALTTAWTSATQVQPEVYLLVQHQMHLLMHLYVYKYWGSPLGATPELILSIFNWPYFASICTLKSILKSILMCVPYTLLFAISGYIFCGSYLWLCCVVPSRLLATLSKMFTPTHVSSIVLELHYMLALSKGQLHFEIIQVSYVLR